ncbi:hypothetical protein L596_016033 [Steinernema carpocapsae]|uniref:Uncharacterized protein n=1 Tax=Steinernema carpocapsae TaxID=34508 RepID=A0A4U5NGW6_STECR|nr:hypothetical protein L596_016033 [Steinernema carpocapsae]
MTGRPLDSTPLLQRMPTLPRPNPPVFVVASKRTRLQKGTFGSRSVTRSQQLLSSPLVLDLEKMASLSLFALFSVVLVACTVSRELLGPRQPPLSDGRCQNLPPATSPLPSPEPPGGLGGVTNLLGGLTSGAGGAGIESILAIVQTLLKTVLGLVSTLLATLTGAASGAVGSASGAGHSLGGIGNLLGGVTGSLGGLTGGLTGGAGGPLSVASGLLGGAGSAGNLASGLLGGVGGAAANAGAKVGA